MNVKTEAATAEKREVEALQATVGARDTSEENTRARLQGVVKAELCAQNQHRRVQKH